MVGNLAGFFHSDYWKGSQITKQLESKAINLWCNKSEFRIKLND